jgi:uncharacterized coiled-coil protein SlyX
VLNLEDDDLSPDVRRHVSQRIRQLEDSITEHQRHAAAIRDQLAEQPPTADHINDLLTHVPTLASALADQTHDQLRALYDAFDLRIQYQPDDDAIDVDITIADTPPTDAASQFWSVPPAGFEPATPALGETSSSLSCALTSGFSGAPV